MKRAVVVLFVCCISSVLPTPSANAAPKPTIVECNFPVVESIILQNSLFNCPLDGLRIRADNVTVDLNGHIIDGNVQSDSADGEAGINNDEEHLGVVVRDGTLRDFEYGARSVIPAGEEGGSGLFENVTAVDNVIDGFVLAASAGPGWTVRDSTATGNGGQGFFLLGRGSVTRNLATGNGMNGFLLNKRSGAVRGNRAISNGIDGFNLTTPLPVAVKRNRAIGNGDDGFDSFASGPTTLVGNVASSNRSDGFEAGNTAHTFDGNRAEGNSENGFWIFSGVGHRLIENIARGNAGNGMLLENDSFAPSTSEVTMRLNNASGNRGDGIDVDVNTLKITANIANRNGFNNGDDDGSGLGIRDSGATEIIARRNKADGNADANECSQTMSCT